MSRAQLRAVLLAALLVVSSMAVVGGASAAPAAGNTAGNVADSTFHVTQGDRCYEVSAYGDGSTTVEDYYDYRNPDNSEEYSWTYSSHGTTEVQENQVSNVYVYNGSGGYSLVMVHDQLDVDEQDAPYGSTITFELSGMPQDGEWIVRDDNYTDDQGNPQDDNWDTEGDTHTIDWMWAGHRTDGGAFLGIAGEEITIDPAFNQEASEWNNWRYAGDSDNRTEEWRLLGTEDGAQTLDMDTQITVEQGACADDTDETPPSADLTASPNPAGNNEKVTFDASGSTDDTGIESYEWDFDGDGTVEETTTDATTTYTYESTGEFDATVTVVDAAGNADTATETVAVGDQPPNAAFSASPTAVGNNEEVSFDAAESSDDNGIDSYEWEFGDGDTATGKTTSHTYTTTGEYEVTLTVTDTDGQTDTATETITVWASDEEAPNANIDAPGTVTVGEEFTLDGSNSTDDTAITDYDWQIGDETSASGATVNHTFDSAGEYEVTLTVTDAAGNTDSTMQLVTAEEQQTEPEPPADDGLTADLKLSQTTADFGEKVGFNASGSTDDGKIVKYEWDLQGDGEVDRKTNESNPVVWHDIVSNFDEPGTYHPTVTVTDDDGNTDTASAKLVVERNDKTKPTATLHVPETAEVGQKVELKASNLKGVESGVQHICWVVGDAHEGHSHDKPEGKIAYHTFDEPGEYTVTLHIVDNAGNSNMIEATINVTESTDDGGKDKGGNDNGDDKNSGDNDNSNDDNDNSNDDNKAVDDDPDTGSTGGGVPSASPNDGNDDGDDGQEKALTDSNDVGEITLDSDAADTSVEMLESAPEDVRSPTAERDGFAALSYVEVSGADQASATFTVSKDRLAELDASPDAVSLFRFENGTWTAVETEQLNATDDAFRFSANASEGAYAVGVDRASIAVGDLRLADDRVAPGDEVTVTATVENDGRAEGTQEVELVVDGETVTTEQVSVAADSTAEVEFTHAFDSSGVHSVSAGDATAEIVVEGIETTEATTDDGPATTEPTETSDESADVPGFGVGVSLVALLAAALLARRRS